MIDNVACGTDADAYADNEDQGNDVDDTHRDTYMLKHTNTHTHTHTRTTHRVFILRNVDHSETKPHRILI